MALAAQLTRLVITTTLLLCYSFVEGKTEGDAALLYYAYKALGGDWQVLNKKDVNFVASARYESSTNTTGWATLDISSSQSYSDITQAYAAGYLEGFVTADLMQKWWVNTLQCDGETPAPVNEWLEQNEVWMRKQVTACAHNFGKGDLKCDYWYQVNLMLLQLDGLTDGYNNASSPNQRLTKLQLLGRQAFDEWDDIYTAINGTSISMDPAKSMLREHCSVLVKVTEDLQNIYTSHVTWGHFCHMLRIFKHYQLHFKSSSIVSFSSFPGALYSGDDYYVSDKGLVVTETTNDVFNIDLFKNVTIQTVPFWIRVTIATRLAESGMQWVDLFSQFNSGTYNNQWQVVDTKLFTPGSPLKPNLLWIAEQIPGYVISADMTPQLVKNGYFPSYNIPYFSFVYNISGYPAQFALYGNSYSYEKCPRANIFRRDQSKVQTLDGMKNIMRYNNYKIDPLSLGDACNAISARCDLNTASGGLVHAAFGGYDCKVTDNLLIKNMTTHALSGPSSETLPPFSWNNWVSVAHVAQPTIYSFPFVPLSPKM